MVIKTVRIPAETLKAATDGRVECMVVADGHSYQGVIENSFFEDVFGESNTPIQKKIAMSNDNLDYLINVATRQLEDGREVVVIR